MNDIRRENELYHYGVPGMRWGVHRATRSLSRATTYKKASKAMASLDKHRAKSVAKLAKLERKAPKLEKRAARSVEKTDVAAAAMRKRAAKYERKAGGLFVSNQKAFKYMRKAAKANAAATAYESKSTKAKAALAKNERLRKTFKQGIDKIDKAKADNGKRYADLYRQHQREM